MKTLCRYEIEGIETFFFEVEGDYGHLQGVYINGATSIELQNELEKLVYDEAHNVKVKELFSPTKDWDFYVECGWFA